MHILPVIRQNSPLNGRCDEDLMGRVSRLWICLPADATESQPRYTDSLETLLAKPPQGSGGVVLRAQGMEGMSSGVRFSDWYHVIETLPPETGEQVHTHVIWSTTFLLLTTRPARRPARQRQSHRVNLIESHPSVFLCPQRKTHWA
jgi:hypothetical protein